MSEQSEEIAPRKEWAWSEIERIVTGHPGITTPELADALEESVTLARWIVSQHPRLEFYQGNHIRLVRTARPRKGKRS